MEENSLKDNGKISIVTVCYNAEKEIEKTLDSILTQTYEAMELIVKDGESQDETISIVKNCIKRYPCKKVLVKTEKDDGIYDAMNKGIEMCSGNWVIFMNAGDVFSNKDVLKKIFSSANIDADVIYGDAIVRDPWGDSIWKGDMTLIEKKMPFCHQTCFIKRETIRGKKFDTSYRIAADYNLILALYKEGKKFWNCGEAVAIFDLGGVSSTNYNDHLDEQIQVRIKNGCLTEEYWDSFSYKKSKIMAGVKKRIDLYCPSFLYGMMRNLYKKYFKHYQVIK